MVSKWRNSESNIDTGKGTLALDKGLYGTKSRNKIRFSMRNPETENSVEQVYRDKETGNIVGSYSDITKRAYKLDDDTEVIFDTEEIKKLKEIAYSSDGWDVQKVIDQSEVDMARLCGEAKRVKPNEESVESVEYLWNGLIATDQAIIVKHAPSKKENLYVVWADQRGLWQQQYLYPDQFEAVDREIEELEGDMREKTEKLVEKIAENNQVEEIVDNQREKLEEAIEKKLEGEELDIETEKEKEKEQELEALI